MTEFPNNFDHWNLNIGDYLVIVAWYLVLELTQPRVPTHPGRCENQSLLLDSLFRPPQVRP